MKLVSFAVLLNWCRSFSHPIPQVLYVYVHVLNVGYFLKYYNHCARCICAVRCRVSAIFCQSPHDVDIWWFLSSGGGSSLPSVCAVYHNVHGSRGWFVADQQWWQLCSRVVICSARPPTAHPTERYVKREALKTSGDAGDADKTRWMLWRQATPCIKACCLWSLPLWQKNELFHYASTAQLLKCGKAIHWNKSTMQNGNHKDRVFYAAIVN